MLEHLGANGVALELQTKPGSLNLHVFSHLRNDFLFSINEKNEHFRALPIPVTLLSRRKKNERETTAEYMNIVSNTF